MQERQLYDLNMILSRFNVQRAFFLADVRKDYFKQITAAHHYAASGFVSQIYPFGVSFSINHWSLPTNFFDLIVLDNIFLDASKLNQAIFEGFRILKEDGCLIIVQYRKSFDTATLPFYIINKKAKLLGLHKIKNYYYDLFSYRDINTWLPFFLPRGFSCEYTVMYSKQKIFPKLLFSKANKILKLHNNATYAVFKNKLSN